MIGMDLSQIASSSVCYRRLIIYSRAAFSNFEIKCYSLIQSKGIIYPSCITVKIIKLQSDRNYKKRIATAIASD